MKEYKMDWNQIEAKWDILKGQVKEKWGKFTDDDLMIIKGKRDDLVGRVKHVYGVAKEEAELQIEDFRKNIKDVKGDIQ